MNPDSFKNLFHESWWDKIKPFIESKECDDIYTFLKKESGRGKMIAPTSDKTFRAFKETSFDDLKVVIMGMCPYHTFLGKTAVADGLLMGCTITNKLQPSLKQFYTAIHKELYPVVDDSIIIMNPDVSYLARQGVLMLNAGLTVEKNKAGSHNKIWEPFIKFLYEEIINNTFTPTIFLGKDAAKMQRYTNPFTHSFEVTHPASASYNDENWDSEGVFIKVNKIVWENTKDSIQWLEMNEPF